MTITIPSWTAVLGIMFLVVFFACCALMRVPDAAPTPAQAYEIAQLRAETDWLRAERKRTRAKLRELPLLDLSPEALTAVTEPQPTVMPVEAPSREAPALTEMLGLPPVGAKRPPVLLAHIWDPNTQDELMVLYGMAFRAGDEMAN